MSMTRRDTIAEAILASRVLFHRYLVGFDDSNHTRQATHLPNHVAWTLGHCSLTLHRCVERINEESPPEADFYSPPLDLAGKTPPRTIRPGSHAAPAVSHPNRQRSPASIKQNSPVSPGRAIREKNT